MMARGRPGLAAALASASGPAPVRTLLLVIMAVSVACALSAIGTAAQDRAAPAPDWQLFQMDDLRERRADAGTAWLQFLRVPDLFAGVYEIEAGGTDSQAPHAADEVYYVVSGRATLVVAGERIEVEAGSVAYVAKDVDHRFEDVEEDLTVLVFFATPGGA